MILPLNILIVEDCRVMQTIITRTLHILNSGAKSIDLACNGREGLRMMENKDYDLLILDINMPVMDGMEMIHQMQKKPRLAGIPVLVVTTESNTSRIETIKRLGTGFVHKPFTPELFKSEILKITAEISQST